MPKKDCPGNGSNKGNSVGCGNKLGSNIMRGLKAKDNKKFPTINHVVNHPWSIGYRKKNKNSEYKEFCGIAAHHLIPSSVVHHSTSIEDDKKKLKKIESSIDQLNAKIDYCKGQITKREGFRDKSEKGSDLEIYHYEIKNKRKSDKTDSEYKVEEKEKEKEEIKQRIARYEESIKGLSEISKNGKKEGGSNKKKSINKEDLDFNEKWENIFNIIEYDINCAENGVFLPTVMAMACKLHVPLHCGGHESGFNYKENGDWAESKEIKNYYDWVRKQLMTFEKLAGASCSVIIEKQEKARRNLCAVSRKTLRKISNFSLTITSDGKDYKSGGPGCGDKISISEKEYAGDINKMFSNLNKIEKLEKEIAKLERRRESLDVGSDEFESNNEMIKEKKEDKLEAESKVEVAKGSLDKKYAEGNKCADREHKGDLDGCLDKLKVFEGKLEVGDMHVL